MPDGLIRNTNSATGNLTPVERANAEDKKVSQVEAKSNVPDLAFTKSENPPPADEINSNVVAIEKKKVIPSTIVGPGSDNSRSQPPNSSDAESTDKHATSEKVNHEASINNNKAQDEHLMGYVLGERQFKISEKAVNSLMQDTELLKMIENGFFAQTDNDFEEEE